MLCHFISFHFRIELKTSTFITSHNSLQNVIMVVNNLDEIATTFNLMLSLFSPNGVWHNLKQIFPLSKSLSKICLATSLPTPRCAASSLVVICLSAIKRVQVFTFSWYERKLAVLDEDHPPAIPCLLENTQTNGKLVHNSVITVHFSGHGTFTWQFPPV